MVLSLQDKMREALSRGHFDHKDELFIAEHGFLHSLGIRAPGQDITLPDSEIKWRVFVQSIYHGVRHIYADTIVLYKV